MTIVYIIVGILLSPVVVIFVNGFIKGFRQASRKGPEVPLEVLLQEMARGCRKHDKAQRLKVYWPDRDE